MNHAKYRELFITSLGAEKGTALYACGLEIKAMWERDRWYYNVLQCMKRGDLNGLKQYLIYKIRPVSPEKFVLDSPYLDKGGVIYPEVLKSYNELNSGKYIEAVLTGGIGSAKTTLAQYTTAYQLYILSCLRSPHAMFNLDPASEILMVFQSLDYGLAKNLEFNRFKALLEGSHYFMDVWTFRRDIESRLVFPNRIEVVPVSGQETSTIGQNVIGGILDEVNYMAVVENSKLSTDGGEYNQAWALYNSIARRRKSRFIVNGVTYGMLCLVSSKRFPGQFTDLKTTESQRQIATTGSTNIFVYDKCVWDVKPAGTYAADDWFYIFIGDDSRQPAVLTDADYARLSEEDRKTKVKSIPSEYREEFERDMINALREVAGVSTLAKSPFLPAIDRVASCFVTKKKSVFNLEEAVLGVDPLKFFKKHIKNPHMPRFAHVDLSKSNDDTGLAIGYVDRFVTMKRGSDTEILPRIVLDGVLAIKPPRFAEIEYEKVRNVLYRLRNMGLPIKWVTFDSYQSVDSMQILRSKGFVTGLQSLDKTINPYRITKATFYDGRVIVSPHYRLLAELRGLEYDPEKEKVDHPPIGSKDVADAVAGVIYGLTTRREIWAMHKVGLSSVPPSIQAALHQPSKEEVAA